MIPYSVLITPTATDDIAEAIEYYNALSGGLGYRFADILLDHLNRIAVWPTAAAVRYKNIRSKPMKRFPYLINYTIDEATRSVHILRLFNTFQRPSG